MRGARGIGLLVIAATSIGAACSYDFDGYAAPGADAGEVESSLPPTPGADGSSATDGGGPSKDGAATTDATAGEDVITPPDDSGPVDSGADGCAEPAPCISAATSCAQACGAAEVTCEAACNTPKCRNDCRAAEGNCRTACKNTCNSCAQAAGCPAPTACDTASQAI